MRHWCENYQSWVSHAHMGGNGRPQISEEKRVRTRELFDDDLRLSLGTVAAEAGVHNKTVWDFWEKNLKYFPYKLQMSTELSEDQKTERKQFAQHYRREMRNDSGYLDRNFFSDKWKFSLSRKWTNKAVESGDLNGRMKCTRHSIAILQSFFRALCLKVR